MKRSLFIFCLILTSAFSLKGEGFKWIGNQWWGISFSYAQKWYSYSAGGERHWTDYWGEGGHMTGVRFGIPIEPVFKYGLGVATGVYCEIYSCVNNAETARIEEAAMYFPFHALYRFQFRPKANFYIETGPAVTAGLVQRVIDPKDSDAHQYYIRFNDGSPRRNNVYWEAGFGFTVNIFRFSALYSVGLTPSKRFFSTMGEMTYFYPVTPTRLTISAGLVF